MPSIIERVADAEAQALSMKKDAERQAREMGAEAQKAAAAQVAAAQEAGRSLVAQAIAAAEEEGAHIAQEICGEQAAKAQAASQKARDSLPKAVTYILERVKA